MLLERESRRAQRYRRPLSILFIDLDCLKRMNDTFGHIVGDQVLRAMGCLLLMRQLRTVDMPFRYGGDEFVAILPETAQEEAFRVALRLEDGASAAAEREGLPNGVSLKFSVGVASYAPPASTTEMLLQAADRALYQAKARGGGVAQAEAPESGATPTETSQPSPSPRASEERPVAADDAQ